MPRLKRFSYALAGTVVLLAAGGLLTFHEGLPLPQKTNSLITPSDEIGGPFHLIKGDGTEVTEADFIGKPTLYYFGFTFCPEVCPTTLYEMQGWIEALGSDSEKLNYVFITVDPERDTPELMSDYVSAFDEKITPLSGTPEEIAKVLAEYHVYAKKVPLENGDYTMDHTAVVYLMNAQNKFVGTIGYGEDQASVLAKLRALIATGAPKA